MSITQDDDFELLGNFAHDLKTPLAAVKSYLELIEESGPLNDKQLHFARRAQQGIERMQRIINELMDFARMERSLDVNLEVCDLTEVVENITGILESVAQEKQVTVQIDIPATEQFVNADPRLLEHVVSNLMMNAIKYNRLGGDVYVEAQDAGDFVRVDFRDTGIGIPKKAQQRVWERFYRVEHRNRKNVEGTGLGLSIVKAVVERHGGQVRAQSKEGEGSTFTFTLPRANSSSPEYDREPPDDIDDTRQEERQSLEDSDSDIREHN